MFYQQIIQTCRNYIERLIELIFFIILTKNKLRSKS